MRSKQESPTEYPPQPYTGEQPYYGDPYAVQQYPPMPQSSSGKTIWRLVVFLVIVCTALIVLQFVVFRLKTVYVIGNDTISSEYIVSLSGLTKGDSIFSVSQEDVQENVQEDQWIILTHLYKQYPNVIYLFVDEREVAASMHSLGIEYTLDINGMVLAEYTDMDYDGNVPAVNGFKVSDATVGSYLSVRNDEQLVAFTNIVSELTIQQYADQIVSINLSDTDALSLLTKGGITVELGTSDYMRAKIGAMRTYIAYLQQLGETSGTLDVTSPVDGKFIRE